MGRQALLLVSCWLAISVTFGEADNTSKSLASKDNVSEESAPRLYRNVPVGVYASAVPYAAVSYRFPALQSGPVPAASRVIPVKEQIILHNANGYLKDSYGNRFLGAPYSAAYQTSIPQQFVKLQGLPAHLTKPIAAAAPRYHIKQIGPQISLGSHYTIPLQAASPTPSNHFYTTSQPVSFAQNYRHLTPTSFQQFQSQPQQLQAPQQQSSSNQAVYADTHSAEKYAHYKSEPKFERLEEKPVITYENAPEDNANSVKQEVVHEQSQIKASPDTQSYTTIVNGKKTVIEIDTNPSVPLLDLTLLEPLKFDNPSPVVPQIAHFLPRINQATYKKLPDFHKQQKNNKGNKIQGDVEIIKGRPKTKPKQKPKKPVVYNHDVPPIKVPVDPSITFKGKPNESPEFSYEINGPNYKETYKEKTLKYNKETNKDPVSYSYNHKEEKDPVSYSYGNVVQKEPVTYSYVTHSKDPGHAKVVHNPINEPPKQLIYTFTPEEHRRKEHIEGPAHPPQRESGESSSAEESDDEGNQGRPQYQQNPRESAEHHDQNGYHEQPRPSHNVDGYKPRPPVHHEHHGYQEQPRITHNEGGFQPISLEVEHRQQPYEEHSSQRHAHPQPYEEHSSERHPHPPQHDQRQHYEEHAPRKQERPAQHDQRQHYEEHAPRKQERPAQHDQRQHYEEHAPRKQERPAQHDQRQHYEEHAPHKQERPAQPFQQPIEVPVQYEQELHPITHEYEEEIRLLPSPSPAALLVDPNQHVQPKKQHQSPHPTSHPHTSDENQEDVSNQQRQPNYSDYQEDYRPTSLPVIHEKSKRIIIEQESPDERHSHNEQMVAKMLEREENNEEEFENAYKNAAFGFPGYDKKPEDIEKDIYSPDSYGESHTQGFTFDDRPFEQYQAQGDKFPKSARLIYKDESDNNKEDYFLNFAVNKPTSLLDRHNNKKEYLKLYESYKPENYFGSGKKQKETEKYIIAPTFAYVTDPEPKKTSFFAQYKAAPPKFGYTFRKQNPRDNSAFASRPFQSFSRKTNFVEPQFQYGFEPIALPRLLDSELAAMASNDSPESEKPALRKKIYKENWYIKKTSTAGGDNS